MPTNVAPQLDELDQFVHDYQASRVASASDDDDLDAFVAKHKALELSNAPPVTAGGSPSQKAAQVGRGIQFEPPAFDLTQVPRDPFTNRLVTAPPIRTTEETAREGTISPGPTHSSIDTEKNPFPGTEHEVQTRSAEDLARSVIPRAFRDQINDPNDMRLIHGEGLMTPVEQQQHPVATGLAQAVTGLTTPENIALTAGTGGLGEVPGLLGKALKFGFSATFGTQMAKGVYDEIPGIKEAWNRGDMGEVQRLATMAGVNTLMAGAAFGHAGRELNEGVNGEAVPTTVPSGTVSAPLAMDNAVTRGARRMQDFEANNAARKGVAGLANAEQGVEAAKQARINAPVEIPRTFNPDEQAKVLQGPPQGPEPNPLEREAAQLREQQEERRAHDPEAFNVADRRRIGAGGEQLHPEAPATLQRQVAALAAGTNPIVYFPKGQGDIPEPPENATVTVVNGDKAGAGTYYHDSSITPKQIRAAVKDGSFGKLLGFTQSKEEALAGNAPTVVVARDADGTELKSGIANSKSPQAIAAQAAELARQFPKAKIGIETPEQVISSRQGVGTKPTGAVRETAVSEQTPPSQRKPQPLAERYSPEVLDEARHELMAGHNLASSFDAPGRYFAAIGQNDEHFTKEEPKRGIRHGGSWYGVGSSRHIVADQFPWYGKITQGPGKLGQLIEKGKGAEYDRLLGQVADHIQRERESSAPIMAEFAPRLHELAQKIDGDDEELSTSLAQLANSDGRGFKNLKKYIGEKIQDAERAHSFFAAVDDAAAEAREASAAETAHHGDEFRTGESGRAGEGEHNPDTQGADRSFRENSESATPAEASEARGLEHRASPDDLDAFVEDYKNRGELAAGNAADDLDAFVEEHQRKNGKAPFKTEALGDLLAPDDNDSTGTRYSGLSLAALKRLLPEDVRERLDAEVKANHRARTLQGGLYDLDSRNAADLIRARNVLKEVPGTPADQEAIYHHLEDPSIRLTPEQAQIRARYIQPLLDEAARIQEKLGGDQVENYVHRIPVGKGNLLDRVVGGEGKVTAGRGLSKSAGSLKSRAMMALEDESGERRVVSIKGGDVTAWDGGHPEQMGRIRGLESQGMMTRGDALDREVEPLRKELAKLETERRTLTATKGREAASQRRIENIDNRQAEIREALQDAHLTDSGRLLSENDLRGRVFVDKGGKQWRIGQTTTKEIEANTGVRYYKNAAASSVLNFLNLRKAERAYDFLERYKNSPEFHEVAMPTGRGGVPAGWRTTELPQFHGYAFEPHTAEVLDWYSKRLNSEGPGLYRKIGDFLRTAIFFNPLIHTPNIGVHWLVEKGITGAGPQNWGRILRTGSRAIDAVIHQNKDFLDALDAGAPLQSARLDAGATTSLLLQRMGRELDANPSAGKKIADALGYANPAKLVKAIYGFSSKATWVTNDVAMLQAAYEHMDRTGQTFKEAIDDVSKHIPDYRLPTRIFNSTSLAKLMANPDLTMFGAYHYGALRSYGEMAKGLLAEDMPQAERMKSLDRLAMLGLVTFVAYPALDQLAKLITGDKTAQFRRAGASTFIYNLAQLAKGDKSPSDVLQSVVTPAVLTKAGIQLAVNHDLFTGKNIVDWSADRKAIAKQLARYAGQNISPVNTGMQVTDGRKSLGQQAAGLFGIKTNVATPAEALARKFAAQRAGTDAPDVDTLERSYLRRRYEDDLRSRKITTADLARDRAAGKLTSEDQKIVLQRAARTRLQNALRNLGPEQALRVWDKATPEEQGQVRQMLAAKLNGIAKLPPEKRAEVRARILEALHPSTGARPTFSGIPTTPPGSEQPQQNF